MKQENDRALFDAITGIDDDLIAETADTPVQNRRKPYWFAAVAAVLILAIGISSFSPGGKESPIPRKPTFLKTVLDIPTPVALPEGMQLTSIQSPGSLGLVNLLASPEYPQMIAKPNQEESVDIPYYDALYVYQKFQGDWVENYRLAEKDIQNLDYFFLRSSQEFLSGEGNQVYSPLNTYLALAMLAECTDGNSRQEILDLLGVSSIEVLRAQAQRIWYASYFTDGVNFSLLANSIWLDDHFSFRTGTVEKLVNNYFASVFHGDLGSDDVNTQLRTWINSQTGNLLTEQTKNIKLDDQTALALVSTLYFSAAWETEFQQSKNTDGTFHSPNGSYTTEFMNAIFSTVYFRGRNYGAIALPLEGEASGYMWLILPDKGYSAQDILRKRNWLDPSGWKIIQNAKVTLSLPKFDISNQNDLLEGMQSLGIHDVFDGNASDFSAISSSNGLYITAIDQAVRVGIDEEGVTGAAYTVIYNSYAGAPIREKKVDFILDRPFLFIITSRDGLPLFTGIVNEP